MPNAIFKYLIFIFIACIPLVHWNAIVDTTMLSRQIWLSVFSIIALLLMLYCQLKYTTLTLIHYLFIGLSALSLLSITYASNTAEAFYTSSKFLLSGTLFFIVFNLLQNQKISILTISKAVAIFAAIACGFQVYELFEKGNIKLLEGKNLYELHSLFGHKNLFSSIMFLSLPFIIYLVIHTTKLIKYLYLFLIIILFTLLIFVQTKAVLLAILLGLGVSIWALFNQLNFSLKIKYSIVSSLVFGILISVFLLKNKLTLLSNNETIIERTLLWQNTWQMIKENSISGVGAGNWQIYFPKYGLQNFVQTNYLISDGYTTFQRPHNDFLWIWSELGILGLLIYLAIFALTIYKAIQNVKTALLATEKILATCFLAAIIGYAFIAAVDFPLERSEHQLLLIILLAIINGKKIAPLKAPNFNHQLITITLLCVTIFNLNVFISRANAETHARKMLTAHAKKNWGTMAKEAQKAINKYYTIDNFSIPLNWYAGVAFSALGNNVDAKKAFEEAYQINPYQIHVLNNIASTNEMEGNHDLALKYYEEALAISPFQPDALLNKSAVLFNKGNINEAFTHILKFKFDAENTQFKNYYLTIAKAKFNNDLTKKELFATKMKIELSNFNNDTFLLNNFEYFKNNSLISH
ncbi:MAG: O-antigen ligase family protein [Candidatus Methylacidiphilales bacterium]